MASSCPREGSDSTSREEVRQRQSTRPSTVPPSLNVQEYVR